MKLSISILSLIMCVVACNFSFASTINVPTDRTNLTGQSIGMEELKMENKYLREPISTKLRLEII